MSDRPNVIVIAGPNGAGKSTVAPALLRDTFGITSFVNADVIAQGLSAFDPEKSAIKAGRIMLRRLKELAAHREDFAFETTLATRTFAPWLKRLRQDLSYRIHIVYFWLPNSDAAIERVRVRVQAGGHSIPEEVVRRRYRRSLKNFFSLYEPIADGWQFVDNTVELVSTVAYRPIGGDAIIVDELRWDAARRTADEDSRDA